jgi:hypothetical protein
MPKGTQKWVVPDSQMDMAFYQYSIIQPAENLKWLGGENGGE